MNKVDQYLRAGTRENTRKSYKAAVEHFEVTWGGFLPATGDSIVRYLADYADRHAISTLKQRLAALAQWHITQGFPDPTKTPTVRQMIKGIRTLHPTQEKQASPLLLRHLEQAVNWLEREASIAAERNDFKTVMRHRRDIALVLIGFWRGFRGDELARLQAENIQVEAGMGITFYLPHTKGDRQHRGSSFKTPALKKLCPVDAYVNWITIAGLVRGPIFRRLDRWGNLADAGINSNSLIPMLRRIFMQAGIPAEMYTSHSLRRGFATWATNNGWDIKSLMSYVGWKDVKSALRYVDAAGSFSEMATQAKSTPTPTPTPTFLTYDA
ncbi:tyrosine-type recombinase/integrase [Pseudomonas quasicaspiana]|uniref:tyrosine-type recombinase/integrase n=1 Tax=Pseudomonas quasicaspiana TaxID=2829821 RepID=UPI001E6364E4|nr:tyrosine-type recombinase/integrase [Pseudomonas quasicaspiana]MCD5972015.1 tyrosine-type recombinase/integrase [Pseudomonas quasicaspiana]